MEEREPIIYHPTLTTELSSSGGFPSRLLEQESAHRQSQLKTTEVMALQQLEGIASLASGDVRTIMSSASPTHSSYDYWQQTF